MGAHTLVWGLHRDSIMIFFFSKTGIMGHTAIDDPFVCLILCLSVSEVPAHHNNSLRLDLLTNCLQLKGPISR